MKTEKTIVKYKGNQYNTSLAYKGSRIESINPGDEIEVPINVARELVEQGNYEFVDKTKKVKKEDK